MISINFDDDDALIGITAVAAAAAVFLVFLLPLIKKNITILILRCSWRHFFFLFFSPCDERRLIVLRMIPVAVNGREKMDYNFLLNIFAFLLHIKQRNCNPPHTTDQFLCDFFNNLLFFFTFLFFFFCFPRFFFFFLLSVSSDILRHFFTSQFVFFYSDSFFSHFHLRIFTFVFLISFSFFQFSCWFINK